MWKPFSVATCLACIALFSACKPDDEPDPLPDPKPVSSVVWEPESLPYNTLGEYGFFAGELRALNPVEGVLPYDLITPLFSDYAEKKRFIWMAEGSSAQYDSDQNILNFDNGTVLIKNFYYDHVLPDAHRKIIETRLLYKIDDAWQFAEYVWDESQNEALLHMQGAYTTVNWLHNGAPKHVNYRIPSESECLTCHKSGSKALPLGPKPQNLDKMFAYADGAYNQLEKWQNMGYLTGNVPAEIARVARWDDPSELLVNRVRAYLDVNCSSCHLEGSHCDYRPIRLAWNETEIESNMGLCVEPHEAIEDGLNYIIFAGSANRSVMHHRMATTDPAQRMPLLGRSLVHEEGLELLKNYINSIDQPCP